MSVGTGSSRVGIVLFYLALKRPVDVFKVLGNCPATMPRSSIRRVHRVSADAGMEMMGS